MAQADPRAELAAKCADALRARRDGDDYPLAASALRAALAEPPSDDEFFAALDHKSLLCAAKADPDAPVALAEDAERLADCDALLSFALAKLASADKPLHRVDRVVSRVKKPLHDAFRAAIEKRLADGGSLPPGVGVHTHKDEPHLYLQQFPPPSPKKSPGRHLAERLVAALTEKARQGEPVCALGDLVAEGDAPALKKALADDAFTTAAVALPVTKSLTLACLSADAPAMLAGDTLLCAVLAARTGAKKPYVAPADLAEALPEAHREAFSRALAERLDAGRLPEGVSARQDEAGRSLCLDNNRPASQILGEKVLAALARRRDAGEGYPAPLAAVARAVVPQIEDGSIARLMKDKAFVGKVVVAVAGRADVPAALAGDEETLASSAATLEFAVGMLSTPDAPLHPLKKVAGKLDAAVRPAFEAAVARHVEQKTLPATLAAHEVKGQTHLRRADCPLPPPAEEALAERLLAALSGARGEGIYPLSVRALLSRFDPEPADKAVKAALAHNAFRARAIVAVPGDLDAPAALAEDRARLASEPRLLEYALSCVRGEDSHAAGVADVCKALAADLRAEFTLAVNGAIAEGTLPPTVACLMVKKKPMLFLRSDLDARPTPVPEATTVPEPEATESEAVDPEAVDPEAAESDAAEPAGEEREAVAQGNLF